MVNGGPAFMISLALAPTVGRKQVLFEGKRYLMDLMIQLIFAGGVVFLVVTENWVELLLTLDCHVHKISA
jgi:hypothetical protein